MKRIIVSVTNDLYTDQRVDKVCNWLQSNGHFVLLVGRKLPSSKPMPQRSYETKRMRLLFTKGALFYAEYNFRLFLLLLFRKKDCLLSNDLDTLFANHWAKKFSKNCKLVYDSHEYYTEVPELLHRPKVRNIWLKIEQKTLPKVDSFYTVNDSIAGFYEERYNRRASVVRNISPKITFKKIKSREELNLPIDKKILILQGAGINIDRGAEEMAEAMNYIENAVFLIVGNGDIIPKLKAEVAGTTLQDKIIFVGRQPYLEMMNYTYHAELGLSLDKPNNPNYKYALPNKLFDYIHTNTPIACSDCVEVRKIVENNEVGIVLPNHNPKEMAQRINELLQNEVQLNQLKENCKKATEVLNWEVETKQLEKIYAFLNE